MDDFGLHAFNFYLLEAASLFFILLTAAQDPAREQEIDGGRQPNDRDDHHAAGAGRGEKRFDRFADRHYVFS